MDRGMKTLVTTANGMFGGAVARELGRRGLPVRGIVRSSPRFDPEATGVEPCVADLDVPETVAAAMAGIDRVFLVTPMDGRIADREKAVIDAAKAAGVRKIVKIYGSVRHEGDPLDQMHLRSIDHLKASGLEWALVSPNSVMETSLLPMAEAVLKEGMFFGISGHGKIGLTALKDVAEVAARVLTDDELSNQNFELTGPAALDLFEVAEAFSRVLERPVSYVDLKEDEFRALLLENTPLNEEQIELEVICHLRLWRDGNANLVTRTINEVLGRDATPVESFIREHIEEFGAAH